MRVTYSRVRETIVTVEKQYVLHIPSVPVALVIQHAKSLGAHRDVPWGTTDGQTGRRTDRYEESNSRISQFCERA